MNDVLSGFNTSKTPREDDLGAMLKDSNETVRYTALLQMYKSRISENTRRFQQLGRLSERGAQHTNELVQHTMFAQLTDGLAQHTDAVVAMLEDPSLEVRLQAISLVGMMEPALFAMHAKAVVARLKSKEPDERIHVMEVIVSLPTATLAQHAGALLARCKDRHSRVRERALFTLSHLEPATLAPHAETLAAKLDDRVDIVRMGALSALGRLEPATLALYADAVLARLEATPFSPYVAPRFPHMSEINSLFSFSRGSSRTSIGSAQPHWIRWPSSIRRRSRRTPPPWSRCSTTLCGSCASQR